METMPLRVPVTQRVEVRSPGNTQHSTELSLPSEISRVSDQYSFFTEPDPDPAFTMNTDPDPAFKMNTDPDLKV